MAIRNGMPRLRFIPALRQWLDAVRRREARQRHPRPTTCQLCGRASTQRRRTKRYCSPACKQRAYRIQRRVRMLRQTTGVLTVEAIYPALTARLRAMQADGLTSRQIATRLNRQGVPTLSGLPRWDADTVLGFTVRNAVVSVSAYQ
jgi:hypothetical protein